MAGGEIFGARFLKKGDFFNKNIPFLANMERCRKFLEYAFREICLYFLFKSILSVRLSKSL